jgi:hypothetical protein
VISVFVAFVVAKLVRAAPGPRRVLLPFCLAALVLAAYGAVVFGLDLTGSSTNFWTSSTVFWSETAAVLAIPVALAARVLWSRSSRSAVADLVVELEHSPPGSVRAALARTLGDPSLELGLCPRAACVRRQRRSRAGLPAPGSGRAVTVLGPEDAPIGALVHDPALSSSRARSSRLPARRRGSRSKTSGCKRAPPPARRGALVASPDRQAGDDERRRLERICTTAHSSGCSGSGSRSS